MTHWFGWRGLSLYFSLCCTIPLILKRASVSVPSRNLHYRLRSLCKSVKKNPPHIVPGTFLSILYYKTDLFNVFFSSEVHVEKSETYALPLSSYPKYNCFYLQLWAEILRRSASSLAASNPRVQGENNCQYFSNNVFIFNQRMFLL